MCCVFIKLDFELLNTIKDITIFLPCYGIKCTLVCAITNIQKLQYLLDKVITLFLWRKQLSVVTKLNVT